MTVWISILHVYFTSSCLTMYFANFNPFGIMKLTVLSSFGVWITSAFFSGF